MSDLPYEWNIEFSSLVCGVIASTAFSVKWGKYDLNCRDVEGEVQKQSVSLYCFAIIREVII